MYQMLHVLFLPVVDSKPEDIKCYGQGGQTEPGT